MFLNEFDRGRKFKETVTGKNRYSTFSRKRVPAIGLNVYGAISWNPNDLYRATALFMAGSVSRRMAVYPRARASSMILMTSARPMPSPRAEDLT